MKFSFFFFFLNFYFLFFFLLILFFLVSLDMSIQYKIDGWEVT